MPENEKLLYTTSREVGKDDPWNIIEIPRSTQKVTIKGISGRSSGLFRSPSIDVTHLVRDNRLIIHPSFFLITGISGEVNINLEVWAEGRIITSCAEDALFALRGAELREDEAMELIYEIIRRIRK